MTSFEVLTMGRIGVDLYPQQVGVGLDQVESFGKYLGGSASNVAVAAARYGRRAAVITRTGDDPFGRFLHQALRKYGVDDRYVTPVKHLPTPVTFCEIFPPDDFPLYFYRLPKAPDLEIYESELDLGAIRQAGVFWVTVTGLSEEPSRTATLAALEARARKDITVLDLDYRPMFWSSREEARHWVQQALPHATVAVGNLDECDTAVGTREPLEAARRLHDAGVKLAIVKQGPKGVLASARGEWGDGQSPHEQGGSGGDRPPEISTAPPVPVDVMNGLGAGDAFGGALCHGLLAGWDTERVMRFANAAGAIVASRLACSDAMPTAAEVDALLAEPKAPREATGA
ncbi:MAG TPA: 5-dehydro-2-deoxygluconokinase [Streptosporangiaceae bacterium]|nr:5-dehydro-2-deoxygluconokinase [Streptosporangiaceae bacterium]